MKRKDDTKILFLFAVIVIVMMVGFRFWKFKQCSAMCEAPVLKHGVVTGIIHADDAPSAVIDFRIVHEGDTVDGVKVVRIHNNEVQFEKNGSIWTQKVDERPNPAWSKDK